MKHIGVLPVVVFVLATTCGTAKAEDPVGFYIGGSLGRADVHADRSVRATLDALDLHGSDLHHFGWKAMMGIRPLPIIGAEAEYIDLGNRSYGSGIAPTVTTGVVHDKGGALFGMLYAPIPVPFFDLYGKIGVARLRSDTRGETAGLVCPAIVPSSCPFFESERTETRPAYGAGVQFKFGAAAVRVEYERFSVSTDRPDLTSIGFTWTF